VSIRKSEVADSARLAANSNCTRCRLEIAAIRRVDSAAEGLVESEGDGGAEGLHCRRCRFPKWEKWRGIFGAREGALPESFVPAARRYAARAMCVFQWAYVVSHAYVSILVYKSQGLT
jgi:hypothetical protein